MGRAGAQRGARADDVALAAGDDPLHADDAVPGAAQGPVAAGAGGRPMMDVTVNIPEVVAEVRALFERYEQALIDKNVEVLDATFWDSPHTIRYAFHENGYGFTQIHAHRVARPPGPGTKEKRIRLEILT